MLFDFTILPNGDSITTVVDREDSVCSNVKKVINTLGREISDEETGPECDRVEEVQGGG